VAIWAVILAAIGLATLFLMMPMMKSQMEMLATLDPETMRSESGLARMQAMNGSMGLSWLLSLFQYFVLSVLLCGAFRATVRPEEKSFAFLRLGWDELRIFGMILVLGIGMIIASVVFFLLVMLVALVIGFALQSVPVLQAALIGVLWIAACCAIIYAMVRLSLMFPLTFIRRQLVIDEAWALARGHFWTLFLPYLLFALIVSVALWAVMMPVFGGLIAGVMQHMAEGPEAVGAFMRGIFAHWAERPLETFGLMALLGSVIHAVYLALTGGALATAALGFLADAGKLPEELLPPEAGME
jgi:hypothetical protein